SLGRRARQSGAAGLFVGSPRVRGRHVAVVDDVMTTGSTVQAAAEALLAAGAASVTILVVARTP
ncbi:MAG: ComF family protein, partial [Achromobacter marplatensis]